MSSPHPFSLSHTDALSDRIFSRQGVLATPTQYPPGTPVPPGTSMFDEEEIETKGKAETEIAQQEAMEEERAVDLTQDWKTSQESDFIKACVAQAPERVDELLSVNPTLANTPARNGVSPLMLAAHLGNIELVQTLLNHKAKINTRISEGGARGMGGANALWFAAERFYLAGIHGGSFAGHTIQEWKKLVELLITNGAEDAILQDGKRKPTSVLTYLIKASQEELATDLIKKRGYWAYGRTTNTSLGDAFYNMYETEEEECYLSYRQLAEVMLETYVINETLDDFLDTPIPKRGGETPLASAVSAGDDFFFRLLLEKGASLEIEDMAEINVSAFAKVIEEIDEEGRHAVAKTLEAANRLFTLAKKLPFTPADEQALKDCLEILGPALNGRKLGKTALEVAVESKNMAVIEALIMAGATTSVYLVDEVRQDWFRLQRLAFVPPLQTLAELEQDIRRWLYMSETGPISKAKMKNIITSVKKYCEKIFSPTLSKALSSRQKDQLYYKLGEVLEQGLALAPKRLRSLVVEAYSKVLPTTPNLYQLASHKISSQKTLSEMADFQSKREVVRSSQLKIESKHNAEDLALSSLNPALTAFDLHKQRGKRKQDETEKAPAFAMHTGEGTHASSSSSTTSALPTEQETTHKKRKAQGKSNS